MELKVKKQFFDLQADKLRDPEETFEVSDERYNEIIEILGDDYVEAIESEKKTVKKTSRSTKTASSETESTAAASSEVAGNE